MPWWKGRSTSSSKSDVSQTPRSTSSSKSDVSQTPRATSSSSAPSPRRARLEFSWPWREGGKKRTGRTDDGTVSRSVSSLTATGTPTPTPLPLPPPSSPPTAVRAAERSPDLARRSSTEETVTFRVSAPARSAPASGFSSPVLSPRRLSSADFFSVAQPGHRGPANLSSRDLPFWCDAAQISPSPDHSPRFSPTSRSRNPSSPSSPLHPIFSEIDGHGGATVHPLPLPPPKSEFSHSFASQWQKGKLIGSGTFGSVYVATNRQTGALCAMKEVSLVSDDPKSTESIKQLEQEIKVLSQLKHQNIVQYYGSEIIDDRFYIFLEYVYPGSINKYVREHFGAITESVVRNFTRHILNGLVYLHSKKTMHRDIKGANLLVDSTGVVKLADFGMAKHLTGEKAVLSLKGTSYWMAPEVVQAMLSKDRGYDLSVDIWSLGCTIIEMFTGKHPWDGYEGAAAMFKVLRDSPQIPEALSAEGKDFLRCCFRRNPAERPTAAQLLDHPFVKSLAQQESPATSLPLVPTHNPLPQDMRSKSERGRTTKIQDGLSGWSPSKSEVPVLTGWGPNMSPRSALETILRLSPPRIAQIPLGPLARRRTGDGVLAHWAAKKETGLFSPFQPNTRETDLRV